jgi:hypothetical protein
MENVIRAMGARDPAVSPCHYKAAFVFVHRSGEPPSAGDLEKFERYRAAFESWYARATDDRGSLDTRLDGCGTGTPQCPGGEDAVGDAPDSAGDDVDAGGDGGAGGCGCRVA